MKKVLATFMALTLCLGVTACGAGQDAVSEKKVIAAAAEDAENYSGTVTVYTSVPQDLADAFKAEFETKYPNVTINIYRATSGEVLTKIKTESEGGQLAGDILWVADFSSAEGLKELGLLDSYTSAEDAAIADAYKDAEHYYYGSRIINMVLAYNTSIEAPDSWKDLTEEALKGKVGIPSVSSGSAFQYIGVMSENADFGWDYFEDLKANGTLQFKANKDVLQRIATGEILAGPVLDYMVTEMREQGSPVDFVIPKEGAIAVASPIAKLKDCKNPELAELFIDFALSEEGQEILVSLNTTPVRADVETPDNVLSLADITVMEDSKGYLSNANEIKNNFNAIFGE